jgi:hypothetical protein
MKINIEMSENLNYKLNCLRQEMIQEERNMITISDMIEEAVLNYYNISIIDLKNINLNEKINFNLIDAINLRNTNKNYYVYCYLNKREIINITVNNVFFKYKPIYFGKGKDDRITSKVGRSEALLSFINELKSTEDFEVVKIIEDLSDKECYFNESIFISSFGKLNDGSGCLYNKSDGFYKKNYFKLGYIDVPKTDYVYSNEQYQFIQYVLKTLNETKNSKDAAKKMNIPERTLFRRLKEYNIMYDKITHSWIINF